MTFYQEQRWGMSFYQGRRWDAPMADDAVLADLTGQTCGMCQEPVVEGDDAMALGSTFHTECLIRSTLGDVAHLEGRCLCFGGRDHDEEGTYREQSRRAMAWIIEHRRGRWREDDQIVRNRS